MTVLLNFWTLDSVCNIYSVLYCPFNILSAELRKFDDVSRFDRDPDIPFWPVLHFNEKGMYGKDKDSTWSELLQTSS